MLENALIVAGGYLIGSIPFGVVVVRLFRGEDIRKQGSGNIGASNVWRTYGRWLGVPVALLDVAKGFVPALIGVKLGGEWVGVLGGGGRDARARPPDLARVQQGRQDGRDRRAGSCSRSRRSRRGDLPRSSGSRRSCSSATRRSHRSSRRWRCRSSASLLEEPWATVIFATAASLAVIALHRQNIGRLLHGTESRFTRGKSSAQQRVELKRLYALSQSASVVCRSPSVPVISERSSPTVPHRSASTS